MLKFEKKSEDIEIGNKMPQMFKFENKTLQMLELVNKILRLVKFEIKCVNFWNF